MIKNIRSIALLAALAVILVAGVVAQQKAADTAIDPVCGMTVVKANAKATFDYKGTTYLFLQSRLQGRFRQGAREVPQGPAGEGDRRRRGRTGRHGPDGAHGRADGWPDGHDEARSHGRLSDVRPGPWA